MALDDAMAHAQNAASLEQVGSGGQVQAEEHLEGIFEYWELLESWDQAHVDGQRKGL